MRLNLTSAVATFILAVSAVTSAETVAFRGQIVDPMRAAVAGARISAAPERRGTPAAAVTDETRGFELPLHADTNRVTVT
jgi:hypothetical protein